MADFRKLALDLISIDGKVDEVEIKLLKKHLYADGKISGDEFAFLVDVRAAAAKKVKEAQPAFDKFFLKALEDKVVADGKTSAEEAALIKKHVLGNESLDAALVEKFLKTVQAKAPSEELTKVLEKDKADKEKKASKSAK